MAHPVLTERMLYGASSTDRAYAAVAYPVLGTTVYPVLTERMVLCHIQHGCLVGDEISQLKAQKNALQ
eukprot:3104198-Rhodomonas_salina.1